MADEAALRSVGIIPNVLERLAPGTPVPLRLVFDGLLEAADGQLLTCAQGASAPVVEVGGDPGELYTLIHTDPDAPDPDKPIRREWLHWMVTNIPGGGSSAAGDEVLTYVGPGPLAGTHRYLFMLFRQQGRVQIVDPSGGERSGRPCFNTRKFAEQQGLGEAVGVAWYTCRREE